MGEHEGTDRPALKLPGKGGIIRGASATGLPICKALLTLLQCLGKVYFPDIEACRGNSVGMR